MKLKLFSLLLLSGLILTLQAGSFTVLLNAAHGGKDPGSVVNDLKEKDLTLAIAKEIEKLNQNNEVEIVLVRADDSFIEQSSRTEKSNTADLYLSIHIANTESPNDNGISIYYPETGSNIKTSAGMAKPFRTHLNGIDQDFVVRKIETSKVADLQASNCPALMLELGYLSNDDNYRFLSEDENITKIAKAILASIEELNK